MDAVTVPGRPRLAGRTREIGQLREHLEAALAGQPKLVLIFGEPGVGKTRLAEELAGIALARGIRAAWGRCVDGGGAPAYWPWRQVLRSDALRIAAPRAQDPLLARIVPDPGNPAAPPGAGDDDAQHRFALFEAVLAHLRAAAGDGLVLFLDDAHWADTPSLLLLLHLARYCGPARLLVVATARDVAAEPDRLSPLLANLLREGATETLRLGGLDPAGVRDCLAEVAGGEVSDAVAGRVHAMTAGNPFLVRELGRGILRGGSVPGGAVPPGVQASVDQRLGTLGPGAARALQAAAVLRGEAPVAVVARMLGIPVREVLDSVGVAARAGLLLPGAGADLVRFSHALIAEAVGAALAPADRVALQRAAAVALEAEFEGRLEPHLAELARLWAAVALGGERVRASGWARRAGDAAMRALAFEAAAPHYAQAVALARGAVPGEELADLLLCQARALQQMADFRACLEVCREATDLAWALDRAELAAEAALVLTDVGDPTINGPLAEWATHALAGLPAEAEALRARLEAQRAHGGVYTGADAEALQRWSGEALALADRSGDRQALVAALGARHLVCSSPEGLPEQAALAARLCEIGRAGRTGSSLLWGLVWSAEAAFARGDFPACEATLPELARCVDRLGLPIGRWHLLRLRAALAQATGRLAEASVLAVQSREAVSGLAHGPGAESNMALVAAIGHHTGAQPEDPPVPEVPGYAPKPFATFFLVAGSWILLERGHPGAAAERYARAGSPDRWAFPPLLEVLGTAHGIITGIALRREADVRTLYERALPHRDAHATPVVGAASSHGPMALHLGAAAGYLGLHDEAAGHLETALRTTTATGARGYRVESLVELAAALIRRSGPGDLARARGLLADAAAEAAGLGMPPWEDRARRLLAGIGLAPGGGTPALSPREAEVAGLVARGLSNRQIAEALVLSERTAENHVAHIMTKLGFGSRAQIAAWVVGQRGG